MFLNNLCLYKTKQNKLNFPQNVFVCFGSFLIKLSNYFFKVKTYKYFFLIIKSQFLKYVNCINCSNLNMNVSSSEVIDSVAAKM